MGMGLLPFGSGAFVRGRSNYNGHSKLAVRLFPFRNCIHRAAKTHVVAGRFERLEALIRSSRLLGTVTVGAAANDAAKFASILSERNRIHPHVAHPFPDVASQVLTTVRARTLRETAAGQFASGSSERGIAQRRVGRMFINSPTDIRAVGAELVAP